MADVKLTMVTDERQMVRAFEKLQRETVKLREQQAALKTELREGAKNAEDMSQTLDGGFGAGVKQMSSMAAGAFSVQQAIGLVRAEYDALIERQREAAGIQVDLSAVQTQALQNLGDDPDIKTAGELVDLVNQVIQKTDALPRVAWQAMSDALSARGDKSAREAADAVTAAIRLSPGTPEQLPTLAGAALDVGKAAGIGSEEALGFILGIGSKSRVTNLESLSKNVAPGALDLLKFGDDLSSAGALVATISQGVNDTEGAVSRTTAVSLAQQLEKFFTRVMPRDDLTSTESRIGALQADPALRQLFLEGGRVQRGDETISQPAASFEKKTFATVREILTGDDQSAVVRQLRAADRDLGAIDPGQKYRDTLEQISQLPAVRVATAQRAFDSSTNQIQSADSEAMSAVVRDGLTDIKKALGKSAISQRAEELLNDIETGGRPDIDRAITEVKRIRALGPESGMIDALDKGASATLDFFNPFLPMEELQRRERMRNTNKLSVDDVGTLDALIVSLESLRDLQQQQLDEARQLRAAQDRAAAAAARGADEARRGANNRAAAGALAIGNGGDK